MDEVVGKALAERFVAAYGRAAAGVFAAPGRVNLIGEHTDYNDGLCLPIALRESTFAAVAPREDQALRISSLQQETVFTGEITTLDPEAINGWPAYAAGVVWSLRESGLPMRGMDLLVDSRVPLGAGLSSSAALECAVALAACSVAGIEVDTDRRHDLVQACMRAEREVAGAPTGGMDQTVSLLARTSHALLIDCRDWTTRQVAWPADAGVDLLVVDTRASHKLSDGQYADRRTECESAAAELGLGSLREVIDLEQALSRLGDERLRQRVRHIHTENQRVRDVVSALEASDLGRIGELFSDSHASLRDDFEVSSPELDVVVETAVASNALGARMTGGGFGGSAIVLARHSETPVIEAAIREAFAAKGWAVPGFLLAVPSSGARRVQLGL